MFLLKFKDKDCWIAPWNGDPGRTVKKYNAKLFKSKEEAELFREKLLKANSHRKFNLIIEEL